MHAAFSAGAAMDTGAGQFSYKQVLSREETQELLQHFSAKAGWIQNNGAGVAKGYGTAWRSA